MSQAHPSHDVAAVPSTADQMQSMRHNISALEGVLYMTVQRLEAVMRIVLLHVHDHPWAEHNREPRMYDNDQLRELIESVTTLPDAFPSLHPEHPCMCCYMKAEIANCLPDNE
jgi:hypothetical protein